MALGAVKKAFRIQFASNLNVHTKTFRESIMQLDPCAPSLALLGDIGLPDCDKTRDFMKWCDTTYETVYWVPGYVELSDIHDKKHTWIDRYGECNESIHKWNLKNTFLCYKTYVQRDDLQVLLTPVFYESDKYALYTYCGHKKAVRMGKKNFNELINSEVDWLLNRTAASKVPVAWFTYASPFVSVGLHKISAPSMLNYPKLLCSLQGQCDNMMYPVYINGTNPWSGVNILGHKTYLKDAYWEHEMK